MRAGFYSTMRGTCAHAAHSSLSNYWHAHFIVKALPCAQTGGSTEERVRCASSRSFCTQAAVSPVVDMLLVFTALLVRRQLFSDRFDVLAVVKACFADSCFHGGEACSGSE